MEIKIFVSTNSTKIALGARKKFSLDYFGRMIVNSLGGFIWKKCLEYFRGYLKLFTSKFSWDATANTKIRCRYFDSIKNMIFELFWKKDCQ